MYYFLSTIVVIAFVLGAVYSIVRRWNKQGPMIDPEKLAKELEEFKKHAEKITVIFQDCRIVSNSHTETALKSGNWRVQALDSLYGDGSSNLQQVNVNQSQIVFRITKGQTHFDYVSPVIFIEKTTLLFKLDFQKETTLYIDKQDPARYYFDLEFLAPREA